MTQITIHYSLHLLLPLLISFLFFRENWKKAYLIMLSTMLVDLDHLLANPIYQADRCSINFHPMHTFYAMSIYVIIIFFRKPFNIIGAGLVLHMITDLIDCLIMYSNCNECFNNSPALEILKFISEISNL